MRRVVVIVCGIVAALIFTAAGLIPFFIYIAFMYEGDVRILDWSVRLATAIVTLGLLTLCVWAGWRLIDK